MGPSFRNERVRMSNGLASPDYIALISEVMTRKISTQTEDIKRDFSTSAGEQIARNQTML
jgi:hypothetical protein